MPMMLMMILGGLNRQTKIFILFLLLLIIFQNHFKIASMIHHPSSIIHNPSSIIHDMMVSILACGSQPSLGSTTERFYKPHGYFGLLFQGAFLQWMGPSVRRGVEPGRVVQMVGSSARRSRQFFFIAKTSRFGWVWAAFAE